MAVQVASMSDFSVISTDSDTHAINGIADATSGDLMLILASLNETGASSGLTVSAPSGWTRLFHQCCSRGWLYWAR